VHIIGVDLNDLDGLKELSRRPRHELAGGDRYGRPHGRFVQTDLAQMRARLQEHQVAYRERTVPSLGLHQVFFEDPSSVTIELNYPAAEAQT
jgi:hypothetical protein